MAEGGFRRALSDFAGALVPLDALDLERHVGDRLARVPNLLNEYGYDGYGMSPDYLRRTSLPSMLMYRYWFRVETHDVDRLPEGRVLVISNHAGQLPFDAAMLSMALLLGLALAYGICQLETISHAHPPALLIL